MPIAFKLLIWSLYLEQWVQLKRPSGVSGAMSPRLLGPETEAIYMCVCIYVYIYIYIYRERERERERENSIRI